MGNSGVDALLSEFWAWRTVTQADSPDDLPRVERPDGWVADWSPDAVAARRRTLAAFELKRDALDLTGEPIPVRVNGKLLDSALAKVRWELDQLRNWQRNPGFYVDQALVPLHEVLLVRQPFEGERAEAVLRHLRRIPETLAHGKENLTGHAAAPFARSAVQMLDGVRQKLETAMRALAPHLPSRLASELPDATTQAADALETYRGWLSEPHDFDPETKSGSLEFFLREVALLPYTPQRLREMARQEWDRAVATEKVLKNRHRDLLPPALPATAAEQVRAQDRAELEIRRFYEEHDLLSQPETLRRYLLTPMPDYLAPLSSLGVTDDLTSASRVGDDAFRYIPEPRADLPYFEIAGAVDPRLGICHEGVHAQQLALGWRHPDPARRHFYDSTPNEGIAFYNEELMLKAGLFDDAPASALIITNFQRLRALRAEIDIALASGELTIEEAAEQIERRVPADRQTAWEEAVFFAGYPGQGLSYQVGKLQITELIADLPAGFGLREFHDRLWREGNVPLALQRWELLG
ncbi:DUF885 family protein [Amycolatopsis sp. cg5]|uniref:DUF885 family protein n=1 Tax=Amycolatopsis sp. cg5 TaxID=3238802 RepID=UPI00352472CD